MRSVGSRKRWQSKEGLPGLTLKLQRRMRHGGLAQSRLGSCAAQSAVVAQGWTGFTDSWAAVGGEETRAGGG
jgi:hypothetical protein